MRISIKPLRCLFILIVLCSCMRSYDEPLKVVFSRNIAGNNQIFTINTDGSGEKQLTFTSGVNSSSPSWSADGSRIIFTRASAVSSIWIMDDDGSNQKQLTDGYFDLHPTWSPDGKKIVFIRQTIGTFTMNSDGSGITQIAAGEYRCSWSPDGARIIYSNPSGNIFSMKPDGSDVVQITTTLYDWYPSISPCGKYIAYQDGIADPQFQVYIMNIDGTNRIQVTSFADNNEGICPVWTPDGEKLVFYYETVMSIYIINRDGTGMKLLAANAESPCVQGKPR